MPLAFPTMAEQVLADWRKQSAVKTVALSTIAMKYGAQVDKQRSFDGVTWTYTFDDDTSLAVRGVGANHKVECMLP